MLAVPRFARHSVSEEDTALIKYIYPDGSHCYRALHSTHAVFRDDKNRLIARASKTDGTLYEFEISRFELLEVGRLYD